MDSVMSDALELRDAIARLRAPDAFETFSALTGAPFLAVELDGEAREDEAAAATLAALPAPSVALVRDLATPAARRWATRFDVVAASPAELGCVTTAIRAAPLAAATLAQLLRHAEARSIEAGLVAESLAYSTLQAGPEFRRWLAARARGPGREPKQPLRVAREGSCLRITLAEPERRNAFSALMRDALVEALSLAACDDSIEQVVLDGAGPAFCAGGDLDEFGTAPDPATAHAVRSARSAARLAAMLAARLEVRVHGACVGAGVELAAFAGRVVAEENAWFALPELAMGLVPGAGGTVSLPRRIGRQRTAWLAFTGARLDASTALHFGLVDEFSSGSGRNTLTKSV